MTQKDHSKLLYRRQFVIGPRYYEEIQGWIKIRISENLYLTAHPDLEITDIRKNTLRIILVGYILDPFSPNKINSEIITDLIKKKDLENEIFNYIGKYGGRWLIIFISKDIFIFNDASGLRQFCYTNNIIEEFWGASQPSIISEILGLTISEDADKFLDYLKKRKEGLLADWWPGNSTLFSEIDHLLPNHYIIVSERISKRMNYRIKVKKIKMKEAALKATFIIKRLIESASKRFPLSLSLSGGLDSRLLLAASRDIANKLYIYTFIGGRAPNISARDALVTRLLLSELNLNHNIIKLQNKIDNDFKELYFKNVFMSSKYRLKFAQALINQYPQDRVSMKGNLSEIVRNFYSLIANKKYSYSMDFALEVWEHHPYTSKYIYKWFKSAKNFSEKNRIEITDLYYWECRMGKWQAMSQLEWDIIHETFCPFNCRNLLLLMLSVKNRYRVKPNNKLYMYMIKSLWSEVLKLPINPAITKFKEKNTLIRKIVNESKFLLFLYLLVKSFINKILKLLFNDKISKQYKDLLKRGQLIKDN